MTERKIDFMKTDLFHIGKFVIHGYGLMIGIGFVLALLVGEYRAKKMGMKEEALIDIAIIAGVSGFLGAKLLYIIVSFKDFIEDPIGVLGSSGFVVYGGLIAGVLLLQARLHLISLRRLKRDLSRKRMTVLMMKSVNIMLSERRRL